MLPPSENSLSHLSSQDAFQYQEPAHQILTSQMQWNELGTTEHVVQFYETDDFLLDAVSSFLIAGLHEDATCIVIATRDHQQALEERLLSRGLDLPMAQAQRKFFKQDAAETLSQFLIDGVIKPERFKQVIGGLLTSAKKGAHPLFIFGEMVILLWQQGYQEETIHLEALWNELGEENAPFVLFCAYPLRDFTGTHSTERARMICDHHSCVIPAESYSVLSTPQERLQAILLLQQQANSLEVERQLLAQQRKSFVSLLTHEVKLPLSALQGNIQLAQRRLLSLLNQILPIPLLVETHELLEEVLAMLSRSQRYLRLLQPLLTTLQDVSSMQEDTLQLHPVKCDLVALVYATIQTYQTVYPTRLISLELPKKDALHVWADYNRLQQVLSLYLNNALMFSLKTEPVHVGIMHKDEKVWVWVQDHGPGLTWEQQEHIWEPFYQASPKPVESDVKMGPGLSLSICRYLVQKQYGQVGVESTTQGGSIFWFMFPLLLSETG